MFNQKQHSNQSVIELNNIHLTLPDQRILFSNLSVNFNHSKQGLIGRNGTGKSLITNLITDFENTKQIFDVKGSVNCQALKIGYFKQVIKNDTDLNIDKNQSIKDFLELNPILDALEKIQNGDVDESLFQLVQDKWNIKQDTATLLHSANLPTSLDFKVSDLSGGQQTKLSIIKLFNNDHDFLILDEPSNHLDIDSKKWLAKLIQQYPHGILLISHDRQLLRVVDCIYQLNSNGLERFGGNYDFYFEQNNINIQALQHKVEHLDKEIKLKKKIQQQNLERMERSQKSGIKKRNSKSHSKMAYDAKKENAQSTNKKRSQQAQQTNVNLKTELLDIKDKMDRYDTQSLSINNQSTNGKQVLYIEDLILPYVNKKINLLFKNNEKLLIKGKNGSGKSTLLNLIKKSNTPNIHCNKKIIMLDQHYSLLDQKQSALDNLSHWLPEQSQSDLRILLANIGLRRERVFLKCSELSGGEQLKLAWLCVSNQNDCLLLLDEPDNHLDIQSKHNLQQCLKQYTGCFILVTHDEDFISDVGVNSVFEI